MTSLQLSFNTVNRDGDNKVHISVMQYSIISEIYFVICALGNITNILSPSRTVFGFTIL